MYASLTISLESSPNCCTNDLFSKELVYWSVCSVEDENFVVEKYLKQMYLKIPITFACRMGLHYQRFWLIFIIHFVRFPKKSRTWSVKK